jgi:hypothetical protein
MELLDLWKPVVLYTGLLGALTVGAVYLATHSGLFVLLVAGGGLLLAVLGGGTAGVVDGAGMVDGVGAESAEGGGDGTELEATGFFARTTANASLRLVLLCYGSGVFLWSLVVLTALRDTLT